MSHSKLLVTQKRPPRRVPLSEAADYTGLSIRTIRRYIAQGRLTGYRIGPTRIRVDLDEVDALFSAIPVAG